MKNTILKIQVFALMFTLLTSGAFAQENRRLSVKEYCDKMKAGGRIEKTASDREVFVIPNTKPKPTKLEQCAEPGPIASSRFTPEELGKIQ